jgi:hypothetical protein
VNSRRLSGWKTPPESHLVVAPSKKVRLIARLSDFDRETELFCRLSPSPPPGALKIVFQLELPSDHEPLKLHEPDNSDTFVSSPQRAFNAAAKLLLTSTKKQESSQRFRRKIKVMDYT